MIKDKLGRKLWTINFQSYRIVGKFILNEKGFQNISKLTNQIFNTVINEHFIIFLLSSNSFNSSVLQKKMLPLPKKAWFFRSRFIKTM